MFMIISFLERITCIIVPQNFRRGPEAIEANVHFLAEDLKNKQLPHLFPKQHFPELKPEFKFKHMVLHNGTILLCGGMFSKSLPFFKQCIQLRHGTWKVHSTLNEDRIHHSTVSAQNTTFIFGGKRSKRTFEYLPKESTKWLMGKTEIPGGFNLGCAIAVKSEQEIWLIGGKDTEKRIVSFNVSNHTFQVIPSQLIVDSTWGWKSALIPNTNKVMVIGFGPGDVGENIAEIIDTEDLSVTTTSPLNARREFYRMDIIKINGEDKLVVFGGCDRSLQPYKTILLKSIEIYNSQTNKWETTNKTFNGDVNGKGCLKVKLSDIIPELRFSVDYFRSLRYKREMEEHNKNKKPSIRDVIADGFAPEATEDKRKTALVAKLNLLRSITYIVETNYEKWIRKDDQFVPVRPGEESILMKLDNNQIWVQCDQGRNHPQNVNGFITVTILETIIREEELEKDYPSYGY